VLEIAEIERDSDFWGLTTVLELLGREILGASGRSNALMDGHLRENQKLTLRFL
jgi:hypothetical protein